jgi:RNA polymerase sigma-54 factor
MRLAVKMLQMSNIELSEFLRQKTETNPFVQLETSGPSSALPSDTQGWRAEVEPTDPFAQVIAPVSLREHLMKQLMLMSSDPEKCLLGEVMIDALDPRGYFLPQAKSAVVEVANVSPEQVEALQREMQHFTPVGIFASSLEECFKLQLADSGVLTPAMLQIIDHLELFKNGQFGALQQLCHMDISEIRHCVQKLRTLAPYPAASFSTEPIWPRIPDLIAEDLGGGDWRITVNPETQPAICVDRTYYAEISARARAQEEQKFMRQNFSQALWFETVLQQRAATLVRVTREIVRQQEAFFEKGIHYLKPLCQRQIAEELDVHESTISRVVSSKSLWTPAGIFDLRLFFSSGVPDCGEENIVRTSRSVSARLRELIQKESPAAPLSDDQLATLLFQQDRIAIARRTVTKHRNTLRIPTATERYRTGQISQWESLHE